MSFIETYGKEIVAIFVPLLIWMLNMLFKSRARLFYGQAHEFTFLVEEPLKDPEGNVLAPTQTAHTRTIVIRNGGKETAHNVELLFNWKPQFVNVWPPRHFEHELEQDRRFTISFSTLSPGEVVGFELLSINYDLPPLLLVRSDECIGKEQHMQPQPIVDPWKIRGALFLMFAGTVAVIYGLIALLQFLVLQTP